MTSIRSAPAAVVLLLALLLAVPDAPGEYAFDDNLRDALASGEQNLAAGKLPEAEVDFENALLIEPENARALARLFQVYEGLGKKLLAERLVVRMREVGGFTPAALSDLERRLEGIATGRAAAAGVGGAVRPLDPGVPSLPRAGPAVVTGTAGEEGGDPLGDTSLEAALDSSAGSSDSLDELGLPPLDSPAGPGDGPDELESALEEDGADRTPVPAASGEDAKDAGRAAKAASEPGLPERSEAAGGASLPETAAPEPVVPSKDYAAMTPEEKFEESLTLARRKDFEKAIPLYVSALQENTSLLARDDFGLRGISQSYYEGRSQREPANANIHFMVGWFAELDSRNEVALGAYKKVVDATGPEDNLHKFARLKVEQIQALLEQYELARKQEEERKREEAFEKRLEKIRTGKLEKTEPGEYLTRATELFTRWKSESTDGLLEESMAYFDGAIALNGKDPKVRLAFAQAKIDQAIAGDAGAKEIARLQLLEALALGPDPETKKQVDSLLQGLGPSPGEKESTSAVARQASED